MAILRPRGTGRLLPAHRKGSPRSRALRKPDLNQPRPRTRPKRRTPGRRGSLTTELPGPSPGRRGQSKAKAGRVAGSGQGSNHSNGWTLDRSAQLMGLHSRTAAPRTDRHLSGRQSVFLQKVRGRFMPGPGATPRLTPAGQQVTSSGQQGASAHPPAPTPWFSRS